MIDLLIYFFAGIGVLAMILLVATVACVMFDDINPTQQALSDVEDLLRNANKPRKRAF